MKKLPALSVMGIINCLSSSFYEYEKTEESIVAKADRFISEGADILDLGAESTRPGFDFISEEEELSRILSPLRSIRASHPHIPVSIDTNKASVALKTLSAGADIINDVTGLRDPDMTRVIADHGAGVVIMHMRGTPSTMDSLTDYEDILLEIKEYFEERIEICLKAGVKKENIILDAGFGFAKTKEQNIFLLQHLDYFNSLGLTQLAGLSRKRFLSAYEGDTAADRLYTTISANICAYQKGARIFRVHDVKENKQALSFAAKIYGDSHVRK
ncbi:dihydropteroate synthase [Parelusimicrobium proximum]|uniref:dihydropteroate synthase n=1 Tax=Parelusimicrobium proximum TaxID=3228953 RepID=UPI003D1860DE